MKFAIILSNSIRSKVYLQYLQKENLIPIEIIYLDNQKIKNKLNLKKFSKISTLYSYKSNTINKKYICSKILKLKAKIIVYSSYSSDIIKNRNILQKKQFIHCHPGKLPYFRGSAVYYYSLLIKKTIFYTTFILNHKIDDGKVFSINKYKDVGYKGINEKIDSELRIKNIVFFLKSKNNKIFMKKNFKKQSKSNLYYVPHPLIRFFSINNILNEK